MSNQHLSPAALDASPPPSLDEALARASRLVSDRAGVIAEALFLETSATEPSVYFAQSRPAALPVAGRHALNFGNATSVDPDRAAMKAVGESIERYCSAFYDESELIFSTYDEIDGKALRPEDFALFSTQQYRDADFPFAPFTRQTPVRWVPGHSLVGDCPTLVPASYVYIPYQSAQNEPTLKDLISTGLACGTTYASALLKALVEVVERDAFTIVWRNRLARPHIDLDAVDDPLIRQFVQVLRRSPIEVSAVLITLDIPIPVILILMTRTDGPPWTIVASGADVSPRAALLLALEEACLALIGIGRMAAAASDYRTAADYGDLTTLPQHALAHAVDPRLRSAIAFLAKPTEIVKLNELPDSTTGNPAANLQTALDEIGPLVTDVVAIDVTTSDIDEVGFKVVRVVVPELQPMDSNHRYPHLGGRRLYDVPWKLGVAARPRELSELNPDPHPFP
jgi:ribosomal protein S12 methylthiotransferase accessory factor